MLKQDDLRAVVFSQGIGHAGSEFRLETKFAEFTVNQWVSATGQLEIWFHLETKKAFEVALLEAAPNPADPPLVWLMQKKRLASDVDFLTKIPGGYSYVPDDVTEDAYREFMVKRILSITGIRFDQQSLHQLGEVVGHSEIKTPVRLGYTFSWKKEGEPADGIHLVQMPISDAVELALLAMREGRTKGIENDSSTEAIFAIYYLWSQGRLER